MERKLTKRVSPSVYICVRECACVGVFCLFEVLIQIHTHARKADKIEVKRSVADTKGFFFLAYPFFPLTRGEKKQEKKSARKRKAGKKRIFARKKRAFVGNMNCTGKQSCE